MKQQRRVVLYGSSLILGAVGASLRRYPDLEILSMGSPLPAEQDLAALAPDVVLFDLGSARPDLAGSMLEVGPRLLLIGLDADSDRMLIWAGEGSRVLSVEDLVSMIHRGERRRGDSLRSGDSETRRMGDAGTHRRDSDSQGNERSKR